MTAYKAFFVVVSIFHKQIFALGADRLFTLRANVGKVCVIATLTIRTVIDDYVLLASERNIALPATKMLDMPGAIHSFSELTNIYQLKTYIHICLHISIICK